MTAAGEGKTTTVGLREPSLGPCFGMKGGTDSLVVVCGDIIAMPGLPRTPAAIGVSDEITNLF